MPQTTTLATTEIAVCNRLREAREMLALARNVFAGALGEKVKDIANYEQAKAKVPLRVAWEVCQAFDISERWLATGEGPQQPKLRLHAMLLLGVNVKTPFTQAYQRFLQPAIAQREAEEMLAMGRATHRGTAAASISPLGDSWTALPNAVDLLKALADDLPLHLQWNIYEKVAALVNELSAEFDAEILAHREWKRSGKGLAARSPWSVVVSRIRPQEKQSLDELRQAVNSLSVPLTLKQLRDRVKTATSASGSKGKLAKHLGVPPSRLSEWLSGTHEPGAEVALRLLAWVTAEEAKQKQNAADVSPSTASKTQSEKAHKHEHKPKSGRRRH